MLLLEDAEGPCEPCAAQAPPHDMEASGAACTLPIDDGVVSNEACTAPALPNGKAEASCTPCAGSGARAAAPPPKEPSHADSVNAESFSTGPCAVQALPHAVRPSGAAMPLSSMAAASHTPCSHANTGDVEPSGTGPCAMQVLPLDDAGASGAARAAAPLPDGDGAASSDRACAASTMPNGGAEVSCEPCSHAGSIDSESTSSSPCTSHMLPNDAAGATHLLDLPFDLLCHVITHGGSGSSSGSSIRFGSRRTCRTFREACHATRTHLQLHWFPPPPPFASALQPTPFGTPPSRLQNSVVRPTPSPHLCSSNSATPAQPESLPSTPAAAASLQISIPAAAPLWRGPPLPAAAAALLWGGLPASRRCQPLRRGDVHDNGGDGPLAQLLGRLPRLATVEFLSFSSATLDLSPLQRCPQLTSLKLVGGFCTVTGLPPLAAGCPRITELDINFSRVVNIHALLAALPRLAKLSLQGREHVGMMKGVGPHLTSLDLSSCGTFCQGPLSTDSSCRRFCHDTFSFAACPNLRSLAMTDCRSLSDLTPVSVLTQLTHLNLARCPRVIDIAPLAACCDLVSLNLSRSGVVDVSPLALCKRLTSLDLSGCCTLGLPMDVTSLASCVRLTLLDLRDGPNVVGVDALASLDTLTVLL